MKKGRTQLEMMIRAYHEMHKSVSPLKLYAGQLQLIEKNWDESKDILCELAFKENSLLAVTDILVALKNQESIDMAQYVVERIFPCLVEKKDYGGVCLVSDKLGIKPSDEQVGKIWSGFFSQDSPSEWTLESLVDCFGKPECFQRGVDKIANAWLAEISGERETKGSLRQPDQMRRFLDFSRVKPKWDNELAKRAYDYWLDDRHHFHEPLFEFLRNEIGVEPAEGKVHAHYAVVLSGKNDRHGEVSSSTLEGLERAIKATGIKPKGEVVRSFYERSLSSRNVCQIQNVEKLTGVRLDEEVVRKKYEELFFAGDIEEIARLNGKLGIAPEFNSDTVQKAYESVFAAGNIRGAMKIYELSKVRPTVSKEMGSDACKHFVKTAICRDEAYGDWESHLEVQRMLRDERDVAKSLFEEPLQGEVRLYIREFVSKGSFRQAQRFSDWWGVEPQVEERYVLACLNGDWRKARELYAESKKEIKKRYPKYAEVMKIAPQ